jgi:hypothetical protein
MYEIPMGFGIIPDRTLSNVALAPEVLLLVGVGLGVSVLAFLADLLHVVGRMTLTDAELGRAPAA